MRRLSAVPEIAQISRSAAPRTLSAPRDNLPKTAPREL
jgi:hypothetical protein